MLQYSGPIWEGQAVEPALWDLLLQKDLLLDLASGEPPFQVVLGVPHHANHGVDHIAEDWVNPRSGQNGRAADETTGLAGLAVFSALREKGIACRLVIAAHPTDHDPNKAPGSPYWTQVFSDPLPRLLFELHGAANHRRHALELSAGRNRVADPLIFGKTLAYFLAEDGILAAQNRPGESEAHLFKSRQETNGKLQNPALETLSLYEAGERGVPALHLEMKAMFRAPDPDYPLAPRPNAAAWQLARALANTIELLNRSDEICISARDLGLSSSAMLVRPALQYEASYLSAIRETPLNEMNDNPDLRTWTHDDFTELVNGTRTLILDGMPEDPPEEYLWLVDQGEFIGRVFFLHWLNEFRLQTDGQVDYWIRPSKRQHGYGRLILRLLLERYRQLGLNRVLISCLSSNLYSQRIIEANGGVLESEILTSDSFGFPRPRRRYWIELA